MAFASVQHTYTEKQCLSAAFDLIQTAIDIKSRYPEGAGHPDLVSDPKIINLIDRLEKWTDILVAREGGL